MSFVSIKIAGPTIAPEQIRRLQEQVAAIAVKTIGAAPEPTAVLVKQVAVQGWSVGAAPLRVAAHVEAKVAATSSVCRNWHGARQKAAHPEERAKRVSRSMGLCDAKSFHNNNAFALNYTPSSLHTYRISDTCRCAPV